MSNADPLPDPDEPAPPDGGGDEPSDPERSGYYASQPPFDPEAYNRVLGDELAGARAELARAAGRVDHARQAVATAEQVAAAAEQAVAELDGDRRQALEAAAAARRSFEGAAAEAYVWRRVGVEQAPLVSVDAARYEVASVYVSAVAERDRHLARRHLAADRSLDDTTRHRAEAVRTAERDLRRAVEELADADAALVAVEERVAAYEVGSHVVVAGFVFPVQGECSFIDSFGAPRNVGTPDEHWHEGTDIMAAIGTPLVAVEDGVLERVRSNRLGGISLRLRGDSGHVYYYAHLAAYAEGVTEGLRVERGDHIGYVGDTGDALGGPPHLHFEIRRPEGGVVNPYPLLRLAWERQLAALDALGERADGVRP
ncbi:MAG: M23 family metallopeptidase [Acidimicrobiia bacterium]|nr:M23 family metallopeptidase [Acidimicrobiia bacterium]